MRMLPLIVAALLASTAAHAQVSGAGCRGETLSGLARCLEAATPPPDEETIDEEAGAELAPEAGGVAIGPGTFQAQTVRPTSVGGALQPTDMRVQPPVANLRADQTGAPPAAASSRRTTAVRNDLRRSSRSFGGAYEFDALAGTGIRVR